jgi:hypothetical protein
MKRKHNNEKELEKARKLAKESMTAPTIKSISGLLEFMKKSEPAIVYGAMISLYHVFQKQLESEGLENTDWLRALRQQYFDELLVCLQSEDLRLQLTGLEKCFAVIVDLSDHFKEFQNQFYLTVVDTLIRLSPSEQLLKGLINELNRFDDFRYYFYKNIAKIIKKRGGEGLVCNTIFLILSRLEPHRPVERITMACKSDLKGLQGDKNNQILVEKQYQSAFSECWLAFATLPFDSTLYQQILEMIHKKVIPFMINPTLLMDFFVDAYNSGISI